MSYYISWTYRGQDGAECGATIDLDEEGRVASDGRKTLRRILAQANPADPFAPSYGYGLSVLERFRLEKSWGFTQASPSEPLIETIARVDQRIIQSLMIAPPRE